MTGIVFPNVANALLPLMQMDRQAEENRLSRERLDRHDQWMQEDRKDAREQRQLEFMSKLDAQQRAQLKDQFEVTGKTAAGILSLPEADQPAAYEAAHQALTAQGYKINLPSKWSPTLRPQLQAFAVQVPKYLEMLGNQPVPMGGGAPAPGGAPPGDVMSRAGNAIGGIESGGNYAAIGPDTGGGNKALGKYQVMASNVPSWTAEILGKPMSPQEFLASPEAQEAVFKGKFGQYVQKYGPEGASKAWFAGEGGMNNPDAKDVLGTSVASYAQKFNKGFGGPQVADAGGFTPTQTPAQNVPNGLPQVAQGDANGTGQGDVGTPPGATPPLAAPPAIGQEIDSLRKQTRANGGDIFKVKGQPEIKDGHYVVRSLQDPSVVVGMIPVKGKDPSAGYRATASGGEEPIPGGPADFARTKQNADQANKLRDDFRSEPDVKRYRVVVPMLESAKDAVSRPTRAADINLVYAFAKLMDPESVVRESEVGMVTATGTVADRLEGLLSQLNGGQMLTPETRAKLVAELESRFKSTEASYNEIANAYGEIADANGIKRSHVVLPIRKPKTEEAKSGTYMGPDNNPISWTEIQSTAKNRGISTDEVINRLGLKPADAR